MDWRGQKLAEDLMQYMLVGSAGVAFLTAYSLASFQLMMLIYAAGLLITLLVTVPSWPVYNRQGLKWLAPDVAAGASDPPRTKPPAAANAKPAATKKAGKASRK